MALLDWIVVGLFLAAVVGVGLWFTKRASKSVEDYFVAGRSIPWWLAGTSMLATSFASDTPLHTTRVIRESGLSGVWFYWNGILNGVVIAFFFSRLWRRTGVVTDNEFLELRYAGKRAAVLRGSLAVFKSLFLELLTMAWITLGMTKIVKTIMGLPDTIAPLGFAVPTEIFVVALLLVLTLLFSVASGFWGVVTTDLMEFSVAMIGAVVLSVVAMQKVGGIEGLREGLKTASPIGDHALDILPTFGASKSGISVFAFSMFLGVQWWASAQIDGSGQRAQRLLACKDERHAIAAGVWSLAVQWLIRSWPWYVAALASVVLYPHLDDGETAYPRMVAELLPVGLKGLMVASFISAFMATIEAHLNLTASYVTNDVYKRFMVKGRDQAFYVKASRSMTLVVAALAGILTLLLPSVLGAFRFKMELMSGLGLIFVLRWFWWRINATSEIAALLTSALAAFTIRFLPFARGDTADASALRLVLIVLLSAAVALIATFATDPEPEEKLIAFYRRVRPPGFWGHIREKAIDQLLTEDAGLAAGAEDSGYRTGPSRAAAEKALASGFGVQELVEPVVATLFVFSGMIGLGKVILGEPLLGGALIAAGAAGGVYTIRRVLGVKTAPGRTP